MWLSALFSCDCHVIVSFPALVANIERSVGIKWSLSARSFCPCPMATQVLSVDWVCVELSSAETMHSLQWLLRSPLRHVRDCVSEDFLSRSLCLQETAANGQRCEYNSSICIEALCSIPRRSTEFFRHNHIHFIAHRFYHSQTYIIKTSYVNPSVSQLVLVSVLLWLEGFVWLWVCKSTSPSSLPCILV